jgi:glutaconate CoA-transferase subunit B
MNGCTHLERIIGAIARLLASAGTVAVGSSSPVEAAAALLAQAAYPGATRALVFRNNIHDPFPESGSELYDRIGQGRIDVFFLSGGQIDGRANLNMVGVGPYPRMPVRFSGNHGTPFIYLMVPRIILFREEHSRRTLVPRVDYVSAPGVTPPDVPRRGGPTDLVTGKAAFTFDRDAAQFTLASVHPPFTVGDIVESTGYEFERPADVPVTLDPPADWLRLLRGPVRAQIAETYPRFAATLAAR